MTIHLSDRLTKLIPLAALILSGCTGDVSDGPQLAAVTGKILQKGQPVQGAEVKFRPVEKEAQGISSAITDEVGQFELQFSAETMGAVVGENQILVTVYGERGPSEVEGQLGPPLAPPREFDLGQISVPAEGLAEKTLEVPAGR